MVELLVLSLRIKHLSSLLRSKIFPALFGVGIFFITTTHAYAVNDADISRLINQGQLEKARIILEKNHPSKADRLFFDGRVFKAQGRLEDAINSFRQLLQHNPNHVNAQRELAHTLMLFERYDTAEEHFRALLSIDQSEHMRDGYRDFLRRIDQNKPIRVSGHFSILPSTNINRGTSNTIFDTTLGQFVINPESREESGVGWQYGLSGHFRHLLNANSRLSLNWAISERQYEKTLFDSSTKSVAMTYEKIENKGDWFISPYYRSINRKDNADSSAIGLHVGLSQPLDAKTRVMVSYKQENSQFLSQAYKNGTFNVTSTSIDYQPSPRVSIEGGIVLERSRPEAIYHIYNGYQLFSRVQKKWVGGLRTALGIEKGKRNFHGIYPLTTNKRDDDFYKISIEFEHPKLEVLGFIPYFSCIYSNSSSNIPFYDYTATDCQLAISKGF